MEKKVLQVRINVDNLELLKKKAKATGHSVSSLARFIIMEFLNKQDK